MSVENGPSKDTTGFTRESHQSDGRTRTPLFSGGIRRLMERLGLDDCSRRTGTESDSREACGERSEKHEKRKTVSFSISDAIRNLRQALQRWSIAGDSDTKEHAEGPRLRVTSGESCLSTTESPGGIDQENLAQKVLELQGDATRVTELHLTHAETLLTVPRDICTLENLVVLRLRHSGLRTLPWEIMLLSRLKVLDLADNSLSRLPRIIGNLGSLEDLDLEDNHIEYLPVELLGLRHLIRLSVAGNPLMSPPSAVCKRGLPAILDALRSRRDAAGEERKDLWANSGPESKSTCSFAWTGTVVPTLWDLCVQCVVKDGVEFCQNATVPPVVKTYLDTEIEYETGVNVMRCSKCLGFYSTKELFDNHTCR